MSAVFDESKKDRFTPELLDRLIRLYIETGVNTVANLHAAWKKSDQEKIRFYLHKLYGSSFSAGAVGVANSAEQTRLLIDANASSDEIDASFRRIESQFEVFREYAQDHLLSDKN